MDSDLTMDLYFDPLTKLLEIHLPCTGERWIYFLHSYNPSPSPSPMSILLPQPELFNPPSSSSSLIEMFEELSPRTSSIEFYVYIDEMTGLLWIHVPFSEIQPWRVYCLPSPHGSEGCYPSPMSSQLNYYEESTSETINFSPSTPITLSTETDLTSHIYLPSPSTSALKVPTHYNTPTTIQLPSPSCSEDIVAPPFLTANANPALQIPRVPPTRTKRKVTRREGCPNNPTGRTGVKKCAACRVAKKECVYAREEDICRRCKNRDIADRCTKEEAPERKRLRRC